MRKSPIVVFFYNRPTHTKRVLESLANASHFTKHDLYLFVDGPKSEFDRDAVKQVISFVKEFGSIYGGNLQVRNNNKGLASSITSSVSALLNKYDSIIVIEDDIVIHPNFLLYMQSALEMYQDKRDIFSISGYSNPPDVFTIPDDYQHDVYLSLRPCSWGWATWKDRWKSVDWEVRDYLVFQKDIISQELFNRGGNDLTKMLELQMNKKIDSWAIRFAYSAFKQQKYTVYPIKSLVNNIGRDGSGVHCSKTDAFFNRLEHNFLPMLPYDIAPDERILKSFKKVYDAPAIITLLSKIKRRLQTMV